MNSTKSGVDMAKKQTTFSPAAPCAAAGVGLLAGTRAESNDSSDNVDWVSPSTLYILSSSYGPVFGSVSKSFTCAFSPSSEVEISFES